MKPLGETAVNFSPPDQVSPNMAIDPVGYFRA